MGGQIVPFSPQDLFSDTRQMKLSVVTLLERRFLFKQHLILENIVYI